MNEIHEAEAELWVLAPDKPEKLEKMRQAHGLEFPVLVDEENETAKAYGVLNEKSGKVPHPAALVISKDGIVRFLRVDVDYKVRPTPEELFSALRALPEASQAGS